MGLELKKFTQETRCMTLILGRMSSGLTLVLLKSMIKVQNDKGTILPCHAVRDT